MHDFATKRNALFACLDDASHELKGTVLDQTNALAAFKRSNQSALEMNYRQGHGRSKQANEEKFIHHLRGKESIFKKPELPITKCLKPRKIPDFQLNPHKWKKYSLEDVDISDQTNSSAAFEFLREIDEQKEAKHTSIMKESPEKFGGDLKIEFKKCSKIRRNLKSLESLEQRDVEIDSPRLKGSKLVMPEYVVGQNKPMLNKKKLNLINSKEKTERAAGKLMLSHLQEEENEDYNE
ncbi:hypothetical protein DOY81_005629 [Sarcophaga bullata]|nr:hypothetical protein DOY81_005629 [Sarcophaga bullata]